MNTLLKIKTGKPRNFVAMDLRTPKYRMKVVQSKKSYNRQRLWERIKSGYRSNDCLITIGTGLIPDEDNVGLVSNHAYGVLEIYEYN